MGDTLELMPNLQKKYDLAIIDPPYGVTDEKWDLNNKIELLAFTRQWLTKLLPLLKPSARLFIFWSRKYMFELKPILDEIQEFYPLEFGGMIVWHFRNVGSMPISWASAPGFSFLNLARNIRIF
jgi:DNA modification methylase